MHLVKTSHPRNVANNKSANTNLVSVIKESIIEFYQQKRSEKQKIRKHQSLTIQLIRAFLLPKSKSYFAFYSPNRNPMPKTDYNIAINTLEQSTLRVLRAK